MSTLTAYGSTIKTLEDTGDRLRIGGYLVLFGSPEEHDATAQRDYFTKSTDFDLPESGALSTVYYHHGLNPTLKSRPLGKARLELRDAGVWMEAELQARDEYEAKIQELVRLGKLGLSSGTASHLVQRSERKNSFGETVHHIDRWPLGLDASLTPTPGEPRTAALCLKALEELADVGEWDYLFEYVCREAAFSGVEFRPDTGIWAVKEWDESKHPRDERGRWTSGGAGMEEAAAILLMPSSSAEDNPFDVLLPEDTNTHAAVHKELKVAEHFLNDTFAEKSRWSGILEIQPRAQLRSNGSKLANCKVLLAAENIPRAAYRYSTILHEMLHSMEDAADRAHYEEYRGWCEGVLEMVMRQLRPDFLKQIGATVPDEALLWRDSHHPYQPYVKQLERLRSRLPPESRDPEFFYYALFAVPLPQRMAKIRELASGLEGREKEEFRRVLLRADTVLRGEAKIK